MLPWLKHEILHSVLIFAEAPYGILLPELDDLNALGLDWRLPSTKAPVQ